MAKIRAATTITPMTTTVVTPWLPLWLRQVRMAKIIRIHSRLAGTRNFQPIRMNWS